jgi:nicotinamide-nucleotide amidase
MQADIITIGDELLIGQTINTNASWIGKELTSNGVNIGRSTTISDTRDEILSAVDQSLNRSDLVIVTGGLGPTKDDITKETLCAYFNTTLESRPDVLERIKSYFTQKGREMLPTNIQQADLPKDCIVLDNYLGTASGMWFEKNGKVLVSIPGVPYEMKALMAKEVLPRAKSFFGFSGMYHETLMTQGLGESWLADKIASWEDRIYNDGLSLAYLPSPGIVKLRLTAKDGASKAKLIKSYFDELKRDLPKYAYGMNGESIFEVVANLLKAEGSTLSTVESCTGGGLANAFVQNPGASDFFQGGLVTYSNDLKMQLADVNKQSLESHGAVSEQVVKEMAEGGLKNLKTTYSIALSGIAGPDGGTEDNPVGTVWIAVASQEITIAKCFRLGNDRGRNLTISALSAANMLRHMLLDIS